MAATADTADVAGTGDVIVLAAVTGTIVLSQALPGRQVCLGTVIAVSAHVASAGTGQQPACESWPTGQAVIRGR
jgi:hypothetical protein